MSVTMTSSPKPPRNSCVAFMRRIYNPLGFSKGYNFTLYVILAGAMMGFVLARVMYLDIDDIFCGNKGGGGNGALPGECYYYKQGRERVGILLHLGAILPAGFLVVFQFTPVIRHKLLIAHRLCGYAILLLSLVSTAGVLMIARNAFGGSFPIQVIVGTASLMFIVSLALAYYNIKRLQVEQHRAWMLRAWVYVSRPHPKNATYIYDLSWKERADSFVQAGFIITMRLIGLIAAQITGPTGEYYEARHCYVLDSMYGHNETVVEYLHPDCSAYYSGQNPDQQALVKSDFGGILPDQLSAGLTVVFAGGSWLALAIHAVGVELYVPSRSLLACIYQLRADLWGCGSFI